MTKDLAAKLHEPMNGSDSKSNRIGEQYLDVLRKAGHRITTQRAQICAYLADTDQHPTPYQVFADLQSIDPTISRATVYNTLNTLQQLGAIVEINFGANHTHYDTDPTPHINLICLQCHTIEDCHCDLSENQQLHTAIAAHGFHAVATKVDILGICRNCHEAQQATIEAETIHHNPN